VAWRGYYGVVEFGYEHLNVNHSLHSVDPISRTIHTNNIERSWRTPKEYVPMSLSAIKYNAYIFPLCF
jgi:hypothetical protein